MNKKTFTLLLIMILTMMVIPMAPEPVSLFAYGIVGQRSGYAGGHEFWFDIDGDGHEDVYAIYAWDNDHLVEMDREWLQ